MSDEEDYMSDTFLKSLTDIRPGLPTSRTAERDRLHEAKSHAQIEEAKGNNIKLAAQKQLEEGLQKALDTNNRGFALLAKMGYKAGQGLGKEGSGRTEPVPIELKRDRAGLGESSARKQRNESLQLSRAKRLKYVDDIREEFRSHQAQRFQSREVIGHIRSVQKVCYRLDTERLSLLEPEVLHYWPRHCLPNLPDPEDVVNQGGDEEKDPPEEMNYSEETLRSILTYLRNTHLYCFWCGSIFEDLQDIEENCPGVDKEEHD